nr:mlo protein like 1 [Quercus suber]
MAAAAAGEWSLKETPTWAVAFVCAVFVIISVLIEHGIHSLGKWFQKRQKKAMNEALEKIKAELMLLGFISLIITVSQIPISKICIPAKAGNIMLPCSKKGYTGSGGNRRKLLWYDEDVTWRLVLAATAGDDYCFKYGKVALVSQSGLHQLHIFIFVLAVFHVLYSVITLVLAKAKMKKWKAWEAETTSLEYQSTNDLSRFRLAHQTSFVQRHSGLSTTTPGLRWGSHMKKAIFEEQTAKAIKKWQKAARERKKLRKAGATDVSSSGFMSGENTPSHNSSPIHLLHKYKINSNDIETVLSSPKAYHSDTELSEIEGPARPSSSDDHETRRAETHHIYFSFVTP